MKMNHDIKHPLLYGKFNKEIHVSNEAFSWGYPAHLISWLCGLIAMYMVESSKSSIKTKIYLKTFSFCWRMKVIFLVHKSKQTLGTLVLVLEFPWSNYLSLQNFCISSLWSLPESLKNHVFTMTKCCLKKKSFSSRKLKSSFVLHVV